jgi:hypothetical protein
MSQEDSDQGVIQAVVDRLEKLRLPMALELQDKVNKGETLNDLDLAFLENVLNDSRKISGMLDKYPAWQPLAARMMSLYNDITTKALENEQNSKSSS